MIDQVFLDKLEEMRLEAVRHALVVAIGYEPITASWTDETGAHMVKTYMAIQDRDRIIEAIIQKLFTSLERRTVEPELKQTGRHAAPALPLDPAPWVYMLFGVSKPTDADDPDDPGWAREPQQETGGFAWFPRKRYEQDRLKYPKEQQ